MFDVKSYFAVARTGRFSSRSLADVGISPDANALLYSLAAIAMRMVDASCQDCDRSGRRSRSLPNFPQNYPVDRRSASQCGMYAAARVGCAMPAARPLVILTRLSAAIRARLPSPALSRLTATLEQLKLEVLAQQIPTNRWTPPLEAAKRASWDSLVGTGS